MTDAEKVVKALREIADPRAEAVVGVDVVAGLADFVLAASAVYDECGMVGCPSNGSMEKQASALARLREVLDA